MARHAARTSQGSPRRALLRAGLTVTAAGAALGLGGGTAAQAVEPTGATVANGDTELATAATAAGQGVFGALGHAAAGALGPVKNLKLNPLAGTGVDPLDNAVGTRIADFKPLSTASLTDPLTKGSASLKDFPVIGGVLGALPG
ncbi:hypothetical protein [Streptomyces sp. NRRL F-5135]|uniref:hypothetical protein n=1 Tax=Streptomyces sp. NRRL F-5135 TaxID=1463858 RepID=UPI0004CA99A9|nr:hypothetical protein [Streptomyces sp. NRRL F-5135]